MLLPHEGKVGLRKAKVGKGRAEENSHTKGQSYHVFGKCLLSISVGQAQFLALGMQQ